NPKIAVARAKCIVEGNELLNTLNPYPDLLNAWNADYLAMAEDIQAGRISIAKANSILEHKASDMQAEEQRRLLANRSVSAQESAPAAAPTQAAASQAAAAAATAAKDKSTHCSGSSSNVGFGASYSWDCF